MKVRPATQGDCGLLAELNHQLIQDEEHRNPMTVSQLEQPMRDWLAGQYRAFIFESEGEVVAYALFCEQTEESTCDSSLWFVTNGGVLWAARRWQCSVRPYGQRTSG